MFHLTVITLKSVHLLLELLLLPFFNIGGGGVEECDEGDVEGV